MLSVCIGILDISSRCLREKSGGLKLWVSGTYNTRNRVTSRVTHHELTCDHLI